MYGKRKGKTENVEREKSSFSSNKRPAFVYLFCTKEEEAGKKHEAKQDWWETQ